MSKWLLLLLIAQPLHSQDIKFSACWGGVDRRADSTKINDCDAFEAINVLTDDNFLRKVGGNVSISSPLLSGESYNALGKFTDSANVDWLVARTSFQIIANNFSDAPITIATSTVRVDFVPAFGRLYIFSKSTQIIQWSGASTSPVEGSPICRYGEFYLERLWCANTSASGSEVRVSSFGGAGHWALSTEREPPADGPDILNIAREDGDNITCLKKTPWGMFVGKPNSLHVIKGIDKPFRNQLISDTEGCIDDQGLGFYKGRLQIPGRGGIHSWGGESGVVRISQQIDLDYQKVRQLSSNENFFKVSLQSEWELGVSSDNGPTPVWDFTTSFNAIRPSSTTHIDTSSTDWANGTLVDLSTNTVGFLTSWYSVIRSSDDFEDGDFTNNPTWVTIFNSFQIIDIGPGDNWLISGAAAGIVDHIGFVSISTSLFGEWSFDYSQNEFDPQPDNFVVSQFFFVNNTTAVAQIRNAYYFLIRRNGSGASAYKAILGKIVSDVDTILSNATMTIVGATGYAFRIIHSTARYIELYQDNVLIASSAVSDLTDSKNFQINLVGANVVRTRINNFIYTGVRSTGIGIATGTIIDTAFSTPVPGPFLVDFTSSTDFSITFTVQSSTANDGGGFNATMDQAPGSLWEDPEKRYWRWSATFRNNLTTDTAVINSIGTSATSTGAYVSVVQLLDSDAEMTEWLNFDVGGTFSPAEEINFFIRAASWAFPNDYSEIVWTAQNNNQIITIATAAYFQFRIDSELTTTTNTIIVSQVIVNWQEGTPSQMASASWDGRYILCVNLSTGSVKNETCFVRQKNDKWIYLKDNSYGAMTIFGNEIVAGDGGTSSKIWKIFQDDINNFDGEPIKSTWTSKCFMMDAPNQNKEIKVVWIESEQVDNASLNVGIAMDKNTNFDRTEINIGSGTWINERVPRKGKEPVGKCVTIQLRNLDIDEGMRTNSYSIYYDIQPLQLN